MKTKKVDLHFKNDDGTYSYVCSSITTSTCKAVKQSYIKRLYEQTASKSARSIAIMKDASRLKAYFDHDYRG